MTSPVYYILVALTLTSAMISVTFFIAWRTLGEKPYALSWSIAFLAASLQWFCSWLPDNLWPYAGMVYLAVVWITVVMQHIGLAVAFLPGVAAITLFASAAMIVQHREKTRPAEWAAAIMIALVGLAQLSTAAVAFLQGPDGNAVYQDLYMHFNFLTLPAGYTGMAIFVIFMMASDLSEEMKELAIRDQLTGLLNRRGFTEHGAAAFSFSRRTGRYVSVVMTDIDRFKEINDEFGHAAGDRALRHFASLLLSRFAWLRRS